METERLTERGVREIAQMQKIIDTLESVIISIHQIALGNKDAINIMFTTWDGNGIFERMYDETKRKIIELQDGKAE